MLETETKIYAFMRSAFDLLLTGVDESKFADQPMPGMNPPAWILGHLAIVADRGCEVLGAPRQLSEAWHTQFGPGSTPSSKLSDYPSKAELLAALDAGHARLSSLALAADPALLAEPHGRERIAALLPTKGDLVAMMMTAHEGTHLGQLSTWRRCIGIPPLF